MAVVVLRHSGYWCRELLAGDHELVLVDLHETVLTDSVVGRYARIHRIREWGDLDGLARVAGDLLATGVEVEMVYSPSEYTQTAAGYLRAVLDGNPSPAFTALATRDKRVMKRVANAAGLYTTPWRTLRTDPEEHERAAVEALGFPLVVKPVDGYGAIGTEVLATPAELAGYLRRCAEAPGRAYDAVLCEAFVPGTEYHADAVLDGGEPVVLLVSRYHVPPRDVRAGRGPVLSIGLEERAHRLLYDTVRDGLVRFAKAAGLRSGPVHLEFFAGAEVGSWRAGGLVFSEIAGRIGGGNISDLVAAYCGVDLRTLTLAQGLGEDLSRLPWRRSPRGTVGMLNLRPERSGVIAALPDPEELRAEPGVSFVSVPAEVGQRYEVGVTSSTWTVVLVVAAETPAALVARAQELVRAHPVPTR